VETDLLQSTLIEKVETDRKGWKLIYYSLHLLENTFDRKRISANPSPNSNPKVQ